MAKDRELQDHERAHSGKPGAKVRHGANVTGSNVTGRHHNEHEEAWAPLKTTRMGVITGMGEHKTTGQLLDEDPVYQRVRNKAKSSPAKSSLSAALREGD